MKSAYQYYNKFIIDIEENESNNNGTKRNKLY